MRDGSGNPAHANANFVWRSVPVGGGGYTLGAIIGPGGRCGIGADVFNGAVRDPTDDRWTYVFTTDSLTEPDYCPDHPTYANNPATFGFCFSHTTKHKFYGDFNGYVYKITTDPAKALTEEGCITATRWNMGANPSNAIWGTSRLLRTNEGYSRWWTPHLAVHPTDDDKVLFGTSNQGAVYTLNGGTTCTDVAGLPACTSIPVNAYSIAVAGEVDYPRILVWADQGNGNYWYIFIQGVGLHRSTAGIAGPYTLKTGGPIAATCLHGEADGTLWITEDQRYTSSSGGAGNAKLWKLTRAGAWTDFGNPFTAAGGSGEPWHVAVDPFNNQHIIVLQERQGCYSVDRGATWGVFNDSAHVSITSGEVEWFQGPYANMSGVVFDPETEGRGLVSEGFGTHTVNEWPWDGGFSFFLHNYSAGLEEKIHGDIKVNPNTGKVCLAGFDAPWTPITSLTEYINIPSFGPTGETAVQIGGQIDWAIDNPNVWYGTCDAGRHAKSVDNAHTWTKLAGAFPLGYEAWLPANPEYWGVPYAGYAGAIAVANQNEFCLMASNNGPFVYSNDSGATITRIALGGGDGFTYVTGHANRALLGRRNLAADKDRPGVFGVVMSNYLGNDLTNPTGGFWVKAAGGAWTQKLVGTIGYNGLSSDGSDNRQFYRCDLKAVPGHPGKWLYTGYDASTGTTPGTGYADKFWLINDDGNSATTQPNSRIRRVYGFGFTENADSDAAYPAVIFRGQVDGVEGFYLTLDWFATLTLIGDSYPMGRMYGVPHQGFEGSMYPGQFGRIFNGAGGNGTMYLTYEDVAAAT